MELSNRHLEPVMVRKEQHKTHEMPVECATFVWKRTFTERELRKIKLGFEPKRMEQKWFIYFEEGKLYLHRSWTGTCIFIIEFNDNNFHKVTVNRNIEQYVCNDVNKDIERLNGVIDTVFGFNMRSGD